MERFVHFFARTNRADMKHKAISYKANKEYIWPQLFWYLPGGYRSLGAFLNTFLNYFFGGEATKGYGIGSGSRKRKEKKIRIFGQLE